MELVKGPMHEVKGTKAFPKERDKSSKICSDEKERRVCLDSSTKVARPKMDKGNVKKQSEPNKKISPSKLGQSSLRQEILELEKRLHDQMVVRGALEKALGYNHASISLSSDSSMPKPTKELIREIALLELEVKHLEQYLLSLYRKAFDPNLSPKESELKPPKTEISKIREDSPKAKKLQPKFQKRNFKEPRPLPITDDCVMVSQEKLLDQGSGINRSQSSLSQRAVCSARISPSEESLARALRSFNSQPFSFLEDVENDSSGVISLADYLGTNVIEHIPETPNKIAEEMVRNMAGVYCKLSDPPLVHHAPSISPASSFSSTSAFSPQHLGGDLSSPGYKRESTLDSRLINPFRVEGLKEFSGPYNNMVEVPLICRDQRRLREVQDLLQSYKLLVCRLETVDPRKLKNDERLAFWINIHNALLMHAFLEYGIPQNNLKKTSLLMKATCNVGGRSINVATIQGLILGCHTYCPGQWFRTLLYSKLKNKGANELQSYAINHYEPLLRFALCSGSHSDPAVRVYTPRRLFQQLEAAKEEFMRATVGIWKEQKILLPKVVESYAKDIKLTSQGLVEMVQRHLPETLRMAMQRCQQGKSSKIIEWVPYNLSFRYLLARDLAFPHLN
ncbi:hypothetical protein LUZ62_052072 [Rhynchospora pubera]|uniref:DUF547 domain-containing protein n=1 Tax=Rhynchospora pubera TaxID=906938 RepID=A0AAV8GAN5_9POAL|nr:hypothetical protein LUZ62_081775 [Rhynchospora pubera]KAJ4800826.1 hypothetical protein LUZ62_052072 [Rhynchospora pubera]